jgi:hypothetical protein
MVGVVLRLASATETLIAFSTGVPKLLIGVAGNLRLFAPIVVLPTVVPYTLGIILSPQYAQLTLCEFCTII